MSAKRYPDLLEMANCSYRPECMRNQGSRIYRFTEQFNETTMKSCQA